eukprot:scaffold137_cov398-Prasinococcus_capsulatus_cf.AAC.66
MANRSLLLAGVLSLLPAALCKFIVETNSLVVEFPPSLAGEQPDELAKGRWTPGEYKSAVGNFGKPPYGASIHGQIFYPDASQYLNVTDKDSPLACHEFEHAEYVQGSCFSCPAALRWGSSGLSAVPEGPAWRFSQVDLPGPACRSGQGCSCGPGRLLLH